MIDKKAIIFDMGGVLLENRVEAVYHKLAEMISVDYSSIDRLIKQHRHALLRGRMSVKDIAKKIRRTYSPGIDVFKMWEEAYYEVMPLNEELLELVGQMRKKFKLAIISNVPDLHAKINKRREVFSQFEVSLISCEIGLMKPQKEIFELALERLNLGAEECVFIDDRKEHLQVPEDMGFKVIHYVNNKQLFRDLRQLEMI